MSEVIPATPGLLARFHQAAEKVAWRPVSETEEHAWIAHLNDEEARMEREEVGESLRITTDSGPVGALVLLLEIEQWGEPVFLHAVNSKAPPFPQGSLEAGWGRIAPKPNGRPLPIEDVVALARYALA
jgi:hypothetical protein